MEWLTLLPFAVFLAIWLVMIVERHRKSCPDCAQPLPFFQSPLTKTKRQWLEGGYLCRNCGCETNVAGEKVAPGTAPRPDAVPKGILLVTPFAVILGILLFFILSPPPQAPKPLPHSAVPQSAVPPQPPVVPQITELGR